MNNNKTNEDIKSVDLSMLPDGVSNFNIDGDEITIYKNGTSIQTQVIGNGEININEIHQKIKKQLEKKQ